MRFLHAFSLAAALLFSAAASAATVNVTADFSQATGATTSSFAYGLDTQDAFDPNIAGTPGNADYKANMAAMDPGIIRYHHVDEMADSAAIQHIGGVTYSRGWVNTATCDWDETKITNALSGSYAYGPTRMIDIVNWPACMYQTGTKKLDPAKYQAYADFCARLVHILNVDLHLGIQYFEVFNELDDAGGLYRGHMDTVAMIYNMARSEMRAEDSTIKVGGPAFRQAYPTQDFDDFFAGAAANLDFVTFHAYAYNDLNQGSETNAQLYNDAAQIGIHSAHDVAADFARQHTANHPQFFLDEFNMNSEGPEYRMTDIHGAIFDAILMINAINSGTSGVMAWNEADDRYGKMGAGAPYGRFPAAYLYQAFNTQLRGTVYQSTPGGNAAQLVPLAVNTGSTYAVALVNRSGAARHVRLTLSGIANLTGTTQFSVMQVSQNNKLKQLPPTNYATLSGSTGYPLLADTITIVSLPTAGH
jgi:xylan 1,4-beta-xylosidase